MILVADFPLINSDSPAGSSSLFKVKRRCETASVNVLYNLLFRR